MYSLLLVIIYLAFISLGLPDSLVGAGWPVMHQDLDVPVAAAGIITMLIAGGTIVSSLLSARLTRCFGAGLVTAVSVLMTAVALFGFAYSGSFMLLCLWAIPYGLGAGAVDAALNNYVALHYSSRHMNWLHCAWGIGAATSPYVMGWSLTAGLGWQHGYWAIGIAQIVLTTLLFLSLPLWTKRDYAQQHADSTDTQASSLRQALRIRGVPYILITFFAYSALETTTSLWASTYLVNSRSMDTATAARFAALFFMGITVGRFLSGLIAEQLGDRRMIRFGILTVIGGIVLVILPLPSNMPALAGLVIVGLGCAPVYPSIIHATPANFGRHNSQAIVGIQMASAYLGATFVPPLFGLLASVISIGILPIFMLMLAVLMLVMSERLNGVLDDAIRV